MPKHLFSTEKKLARLIDEYFQQFEQAIDTTNENLIETRPSSVKTKKDNKDVEPITITGLALYLGFNSLREFDDYEFDGQFSDVLKRGRLRVEAAYERKLHLQQPHTGVIFALKSMGWGEKTDGNPGGNTEIKMIKIEIIKLISTPELASAEDEVAL